MLICDLKQLSKEEFLKLEGMTDVIYNALQNSKEGYIIIQHKDRGDIHHGYTSAFGEGISVRMDNSDECYITSVIQHIDWDKKEFQTLNSIYKFEFKLI